VKPRRLASFIDSLLHNRKPQAFKADPEDVQAIRAAIELRAAEPGAAEPTDEFIRGLQDRLRERIGAPPALPAEAAEVDEALEKDGLGARRMSRRRLLEGAGIAASAALIGGVADHLIEGRPALQEGAQQPMVPDSGRWVTVASADRVAGSRVTPFLMNDVAGFLVNERGTLRGLSGTCTHQGCALHANADSGRLDCPCHRAAFSLDGTVLFHEFAGPLRPLPTLRVRRAGNDIQVLLPPSQTVPG
jgi:cytochrome b6-f complex iron-sulfur subunit